MIITKAVYGEPMSIDVEISKYGRPVVWLSEWRSFGGVAVGKCIFTNKAAAIKHARENSIAESADVSARRRYPHDNRDGSNCGLDPVFVSQWETEGGGCSTVTRMEVEK